MRIKALRDLSKAPESVPDGARTESPFFDGFSRPSEPETRQPGPLARVICVSCAESAYRVADIRHEDWCSYVDGPVCPDVPN